MSERVTAVLRLLAFALLLGLSVPAPAQPAYPTRAVRFITPFPPGGSLDPLTRLSAQKLSERWGQPGVVENRPGGNSIIGTNAVAKAAPDGYTLLVAGTPHVINPSLFPTPYDALRDFAPIATLGIQPHVLVLHPGVAASTVLELIALAKNSPGQFTFASSGSGGTSHMAGEMFNMLAGVKIRHIPYKGGGPATIDLIGGHVQMFYSVPVNIVGHVQSGKLKALAVTGETRLTALPQTPTFAEGGLRGMDVKTWT